MSGARARTVCDDGFDDDDLTNYEYLLLINTRVDFLDPRLFRPKFY